MTVDAVPPEFLQPAPPRAIFARMLRNLVNAYRRRADGAPTLH